MKILQFIYVKFPGFIACTLTLLCITACKRTDAIAPYVFAPLSISLANNNLTFSVDRVVNNKELNIRYQLIVVSVTKNACVDNCVYWEIALDENSKSSARKFSGHIAYAVTPDGMQTRRTARVLRSGDYTVGITLSVFDQTDQSDRQLSAIGQLQLDIDNDGRYLLNVIK